VCWNLWIHEVVRDELTIWAAAQDMSPSQLVQELLWHVSGVLVSLMQCLPDRGIR
jgi:hypothetical protein